MGDSWRPLRSDDFDPFAGELIRALVTIDYRHDGKAESLALPVFATGRGEGPTMLVCGGTHGDEYEGQWAATELCRTLTADQVAGRVIVVPMVNLPAARAGQRTSPLDGADMNRLFPPGAAEGPSAAIARFLWERLIPACDLLLDIHSGGNDHDFVLSSNLQGRIGDKDMEADVTALLAMDAPYAIVFAEDEDGMPHGGTIEAAARSLGKRCFSSELGGGGRLTPESAPTAVRAATNLMRHFGLLAGRAPSRTESRSRLLTLARPENYAVTPVEGLFAPSRRLGERVRAGEPLGQLCRLDEPGFPLLPVTARCDGIVVAVSARGRVPAGTPLVFVAEPA